MGDSRRVYSGSPEPDAVNALNYVGLVKTVGLEPDSLLRAYFAGGQYQVTPTREWQMHVYKNKETKALNTSPIRQAYYEVS